MRAVLAHAAVGIALVQEASGAGLVDLRVAAEQAVVLAAEDALAFGGAAPPPRAREGALRLVKKTRVAYPAGSKVVVRGRSDGASVGVVGGRRGDREAGGDGGVGHVDRGGGGAEGEEEEGE